MKLVIDIPNSDYETIKKLSKNITHYGTSVMIYEAIRKATPLPKGHGRLIDADALIFNADYNEPLISKRDFDFAPTIIEADKEQENEDKEIL